MLIISDLDDHQMVELTNFIERLREAAAAAADVEQGAPEKVIIPDGFESSDGTRWDNPLGAPTRRR
jgi:hypothetical protein